MNKAQRIRHYRKNVKALRKTLKERFKQGEAISQLLADNCQAIDALIIELWQQHQLSEHEDICLIAVGGYGRQELHPYSDIDLLLLSAKELNDEQKALIEKFVIFLWDIGFEASHSVRTLGQCIEAAHNDITIITNLMEGRLLVGSEQLFQRFVDAHAPDQMWPSKAFFEAKQQEQRARYHKYNETSYNLEPNVKHGPGGLRDIHTIAWVAKRHFGAKTLHDLVEHEFLTEDEYETLLSGQHFLWRVTFALHFLHNKRGSRLSFDNQKALAQQFGYQDNEQKLAIEQFMRDYYLMIKSLRELNDMLLELLREAIILRGKENITAIDDDFQICNDYIDVCSKHLFIDKPEALLRIFILLGQHPEIKGVRARTIRLILENKQLINDDFRNNEAHRRLFIALLKLSNYLAPQLQLMNRYNVLGNYIPEFGQIVGQMQYDLYHAYTVDQHSIFVIRNMERFSQVEFRAQFPLCADVIASIPKQEILYLAAIFHDIAKGRGGNHSTLGSADASQFCQQHYLSEEDIELVSWLVQNHLLMSSTAQRKDIADPETIQNFAEEVQDQRHLDHLYLLTVADICATNPSLWNSWRDTLLRELYQATYAVLTEQSKHMDDEQIILDKKLSALEYLAADEITSDQVEPLWLHFRTHYFLRESARNIAWHTAAILAHGTSEKPLILSKQHYLQGGTEVFIYTPLQETNFAIASTLLANNHVNIVEARILRTNNEYTLSTYVILDENNKAIENPDRLQYIRESLYKHYLSGKLLRLSQRHISKRARHFSVPTRVLFSPDPNRDRTIIRVISADRPGLLARIAKAFFDHEIIVQNAKISTMGERLEDVFFVTDKQNRAINNPAIQEQLREKIVKAISPQT